MNNLSQEEIRRVHCLYYGCDAILMEKSDLLNKAETSQPHLVTYLQNSTISDNKTFKLEGLAVAMYGVDYVKLLLRPLSTITDEDAIEVAKILRLVNPLVNRDVHPTRGAVMEMRSAESGKVFYIYKNDGIGDLFWLDPYEPGGPNVDTDAYVLVHQYLVQKGYAVPLFFGIDHPLNGKTAIECEIALDSTTLKS